MQIMQPLSRLRRGLRKPNKPRPRGFTIIELMVVVSILAILVALAAPSFTPLIERWRVQQAQKGLESTLYYARAEAIKRGGNITVRKHPSGTNGCALASGTDDWDCGWFVFVDTNNNGTLNAGEEVLQSFTTPPNIDVTRTNGGSSIQFDRWGRISGTYVGFSLVPHNKSISELSARGLCMSSGGRIRIIKSEDMPCTSG
jgi:type IV fimbrial biogenesis protein FimT